MENYLCGKRNDGFLLSPSIDGVDTARVPHLVLGLLVSSSASTNCKHPESTNERRCPGTSVGVLSTLDFGKKDGRAARGTGIRLSPTFCNHTGKMINSRLWNWVTVQLLHASV